MKNIKIITFPDGKIAYTSGNAEVSVNKQKPIQIQEFEVSDKMEKDFFNEPRKFDVDGKKKKISLKIVKSK